MSTDKIDAGIEKELAILEEEGRAKSKERIICSYLSPRNEKGPRYKLVGSDMEFMRFNSNSYLALSNHPDLIKAADEATRKFGVGPGAVRFIDGTFIHHVRLEENIARFTGKPCAKIFNSAYTANCGLALGITNPKTYWIGDQLNHNSIIRAMRISNVPKQNKGIYKHNNLNDLKRCLDAVSPDMERVIVIFDGIFSMRGDYAPIADIVRICEQYNNRFKEGVVTVVDDSHGIGAFGNTGRGTPEYTGASPDIVVGTFGKAFGVNGGFIAASKQVIELVRQKADTYIYTNPLSVADCAAAAKALDICDSQEGWRLLKKLAAQTQRFRNGLNRLKMESIEGPHPIVPLLVRDSAKTRELVSYLYDNGVLVVGLTFPVVPKGEETIRFQINACHTPDDIDHVLELLNGF